MTSRSTSAPPKITSAPPGLQARAPGSLRHPFPTEDSHHRPHRLPAEDRVVDPLPVVLLQPQFQGGQGGDGPRQADQGRPPDASAGIASRGPVQLGHDGGPGRRHLPGGGRVAAQEALGQTNTADVEGHGDDVAARLGHDLGGAAADVEHHDGGVRRRQVPVAPA